MLVYSGAFIETPLCVLIDPFVWSKLQLRLQRESDDLIRDIYDGSEYQKHSGFLSSKFNVSLLLNTDGVQVFSSSKKEVWPIWLVINELPPTLRYVKIYFPVICSLCL